MRHTTNHSDVEEFHRVFDVDSAWKGTMEIDQKVLDLRARLIHEEVVKELLPALEHFRNHPSLENLAEVADGLVDSVYVILGTAIALDLPWDALWNEVQNSNMAKVHADGTVRRREDGKILKPDGWKPPDIFKHIMRWHTERVLATNKELRYQYAQSDLRAKFPDRTSENPKAV